MKNVLLIVNAVLVIAVGTLFYLHFSKKANTGQPATMKDGANSASGQGFKIAYFEMDSIENNYNYFKEVRNKFRAKEENLNSRLQNLKDEYNKLWEESSQLAPKMSDEEKMKRQQKLQTLEEDFKRTQSSEYAALQNESFRDRQEVVKKIQDFLKKYNQEKGFAFIFSSNPDLIFYKDSAYNITTDLINGLNAAFKDKK